MNRLYHSRRAAAAGWPHSFQAKQTLGCTRQQQDSSSKTATRQQKGSKKSATGQQQQESTRGQTRLQQKPQQDTTKKKHGKNRPQKYRNQAATQTPQKLNKKETKAATGAFAQPGGCEAAYGNVRGRLSIRRPPPAAVQGLTHGVRWEPVGPSHDFTPWRV